MNFAFQRGDLRAHFQLTEARAGCSFGKVLEAKCWGGYALALFNFTCLDLAS